MLSAILGGPCLTYSSGLAAWHSMFVRINPKRVAIGDGYHGVHGIISVMERLSGVKKLPLDCDESELGPGDIIHVETPLNPTGEARNLAHYAAKARAVGAYLTVDATFAPPPLQDPFTFGADFVMHSGTKYFGGHSDMLCGVLAVRPGIADEHMADLKSERLVLGNVMGSFEGWLGIRSLRTLELRVTRQSETATALVDWLVSQIGDESTPSGKTVERVLHASLQEAAGSPGFAAGTRGEEKNGDSAAKDSVRRGDEYWLRKQMPRGFGPVFAIVMKEEQMAKRLPSRLKIFQHATSLGGVESLIEWRAMTDPYVDQRLLRVSIGVEGLEDLKEDFEQAFKDLVQ